MVRVVRGREIGQGPSKPLRPRGLGQLPCEGSLLRGRSPRGKPPHQGRWPRSRPEGFSPLTGSIAKSRAGHARPLRGDTNGWFTRGAREGGSPPLCSGRVVARLRVVTQGPSESPSPLTRPAPFDKGASLSPLRGFGGAPDSKVEEGAGALRTKSNTAFV